MAGMDKGLFLGDRLALLTACSYEIYLAAFYLQEETSLAGRKMSSHSLLSLPVPGAGLLHRPGVPARITAMP